MTPASRLHVVELYAGTARSAQPFLKWRRCNISLLVDNDPLARETYLQNFPRAPYLERNLTHAHSDSLLAKAGGKVDILLGCPPCQGFSDAGLRDPEDPRNSHLMNFCRLALSFRPKAIAMENVPLAAAGREFPIFTKQIEKAGYRWTAGILNAALRGSCQTRQRLVYIAIREDVKATPQIPETTHSGTQKYFNYRDHVMNALEPDRMTMLGETPGMQRIRESLPFQESSLGHLPAPYVAEVLEGLPRTDTDSAEELNHEVWAHTPVCLRRMGRINEGGRWSGGTDHYSHSYGRLHRKGLARTITTFFPNAGSGRFWHPTHNRALTLREAARIQGFPDSFTFVEPYSRAAQLVGNALDASISSVVYNIVRNCLE